jgi:hypothetical protein
LPCTIGGHATLSVAGALDFQNGLSDTGTVNVAKTGSIIGTSANFIGAVTNNGMIAVATGIFSFSALVTGTGTMSVSDAGTLTLLAGASSGQIASFGTGSAATLDLGTPLDFAGSIANFAGSDIIDLLQTAATTLSYTGNVLTVLDNTQTVASLTFQGNYTQNDFTLSSDQHGGTDITFK